MKKHFTTLILIIVTLANIFATQSASIVNKNNPQSILYVFQKFVNFPTDTIAYYLASKGIYYEIFLNDEKVGGKPSSYFGYDFEGEEYDEIYQIGYFLDTTKNAIRRELTYLDGKRIFNVEEYILLSSADNSKFIFSEYGGVPALASQRNFEIYDYDF